MTLKDGIDLVKVIVGLAIAAAIGTATLVGYKHFTRDYTVTVDNDGKATARVVAATLYSRSDLRVSQLAGTVQGTGAATRLWGWLKSSQVLKAPFTVDYFVKLRDLRLRDFRYDEGRRVLFVKVPDVIPAPPNIKLADASLNNVKGVFVGRGAMIEMGQKAAASARKASTEAARSPENMVKARDYARSALEQLFGGTLRAAGLDVRVEVRFNGEGSSPSTEQWDMTRSIAEVMADLKK